MFRNEKRKRTSIKITLGCIKVSFSKLFYHNKQPYIKFFSAFRCLTKENVVILDSGNFIKGWYSYLFVFSILQLYITDYKLFFH